MSARALTTTRLTDDGPRAQATSIYAEKEYGLAVAATERATWRLAETADGRFHAPLLLRSVPGSSALDVATPYGYGGMHLDPSLTREERTGAWQSFVDCLREHDVVSAFFRFAPFTDQDLGAGDLGGLQVEQVSETVLVDLADPEHMWTSMLGRARTAVRGAQRRGLSAQVVEVTDAGLRDFRDLYDSTMARVGAPAQHHHGPDYYRHLLATPQSVVLVRVVDTDRRTVASCLALVDARVVHYHLSGSDGTTPGATNLMLWTLLTWSREMGREVVHLGGGLRPGDSLFRFKESFGGRRAPFRVGRLVVDDEAYSALLDQQARTTGRSRRALEDSGYFPAYRSPGV